MPLNLCMHTKEDTVHTELDQVQEGFYKEPTETAADDVQKEAAVLLRCQGRRLTRGGAWQPIEIHELLSAQAIGVEVMCDGLELRQDELAVIALVEANERERLHVTRRQQPIVDNPHITRTSAEAVSGRLVAVTADLVWSISDDGAQVAHLDSLWVDAVGDALDSRPPARHLKDLADLITDDRRADRDALRLVHGLKACVDAASGGLGMAKLHGNGLSAQCAILGIQVVDVLGEEDHTAHLQAGVEQHT
eukprot:7391710-Prymnesium_polylepis.1